MALRFPVCWLIPALLSSCNSWGQFWETRSDAKALTAFALPASGLTGKIYASAVTLYAEGTTTLSLQAATFTSTGQSVKVNGVEQVSGVTQNDFSAPITYTVSATDGSTRDYLVVVLAPRLVAGLSAWYKADALAYADGATIATWSDSSANANHLGLTYGTKPVMKTGIVNGKAVGRFTRVGTTDGIYSNSVTGFSGSSFTYFIVFRRSAYNAQEQYIFFVNDGSAGCSGTGLAQSIQAGAGGGLLVNRPCSSYYVTAGPDFTDTSAFHLLSMRYDSASSRSQQLLDGSSTFDATIAAQTLPAISKFMLGNYDHNAGAGDRVFDGDLAELLFYSAALSDADRTRVSCYLSEKYGLAVNCQ